MHTRTRVCTVDPHWEQTLMQRLISDGQTDGSTGVALNSDLVEKWLPISILTDWGSIFNVKKTPRFNDPHA